MLNRNVCKTQIQQTCFCNVFFNIESTFRDVDASLTETLNYNILNVVIQRFWDVDSTFQHISVLYGIVTRFKVGSHIFKIFCNDLIHDNSY